jgi:hypothetical protein
MSSKRIQEEKSTETEIIYEPIKTRQPELTAAMIAYVVQAVLSRPTDGDLPVIA